MKELMDSAMHRHDISDHAWSLLAPLLPGRRGDWGGRAKDNRLFVNAIFWILRTGAPWRDLPVAQSDRALASGAKGRAFESHRAYQNIFPLLWQGENILFNCFHR